MGTKLTTGQLAILAGLAGTVCIVGAILVAIIAVPTLRPAPTPVVLIATDTATLAPPATDTPIVEVTPTGTPTATQTPVLITVAPPQPQEPSCTNGNQSLNVRGGPGTIYPVVGALDRNQTAPVVGQNSGWWKLNIPGDFWASGGEGYCKGNEAASNVPFINAPPTPTPTATLTPTPTLTPTVGVPCGGCRNVADPSTCHPVALNHATPAGAFCIARGWWDAPTESGRALLEAPLLAGDQPRAAKPLRYEGWFSLPASFPASLGFTEVVTHPQVIDDSHLWGDILDQVPDETVHWWWPAWGPITLTVGTAPTPGTINWHAEIEVVDLIIGGPVENIDLTCNGGSGSASGTTGSNGRVTLQWQGLSENTLTCTAQKAGWETQTAMRSGINPTSTEMTIVFVPVIPEGTNKGNWAIEYVALYNDEVGAPAGGIENITICTRRFQTGFIIWRSSPDYKVVPICTGEPRTFWLLTDTWDQVSPIPCDPPTTTGLYLPDRGIGWAWCQQPGLKERLGYSVDADEQCEAADWGRQQRFTGGMLIWVPQWNTVVHLKALGGQWATFDFSPR